MTPEQIRAARSRAYAVISNPSTASIQEARTVLILAHEVEALQRQIENMKVAQ